MNSAAQIATNTLLIPGRKQNYTIVHNTVVGCASIASLDSTRCNRINRSR